MNTPTCPRCGSANTIAASYGCVHCDALWSEGLTVGEVTEWHPGESDDGRTQPPVTDSEQAPAAATDRQNSITWEAVATCCGCGEPSVTDLYMVGHKSLRFSFCKKHAKRVRRFLRRMDRGYRPTPDPNPNSEYRYEVVARHTHVVTEQGEAMLKAMLPESEGIDEVTISAGDRLMVGPVPLCSLRYQGQDAYIIENRTEEDIFVEWVHWYREPSSTEATPLRYLAVTGPLAHTPSHESPQVEAPDAPH